MTAGADLARWATLAIWDDESAYREFLESPLAPEHQPGVIESWRAEFDLLHAHGAWAGSNPFDACPTVTDPGGPIAVLTRATIPLRHWRAFRRAVPPVDANLHGQPGLLATIGVGERPVGLQATFSLWSDASAVNAFAYRGPHAAVIEAQARYAWFSESLFARLVPRGSYGTWSGVDPLASRGDTPTGHSMP